uniref:RNA-binding Sun protein 16S rRNA m5C967 methyltransferase, S-adenosyl-L-methionine-dependent n=1 Tax=mine drainage metagenome TaxID=410659 RepID=E6Q4N3_9ZZZZ
MSAREVALLVLRDVFPVEPGVEARPAQAALAYRAERGKLDARDRRFATELSYGAIKMRRALDDALRPFLKERAKTLPSTIQELLRLAVYELRYTHPDVHATLFEWVNLAKRYGHQGLGSLVNAVLRSYLREPTPAPQRENYVDIDDYYGALYSLPTWLVRRWHARFGDATIERICREANDPAAHALVGLGKADEVLELMASRGMEASRSALARDAVLVRASESAALDLVESETLPFWMQSESSAAIVDLLDPQVGERILDCCSGRGNKALQIGVRIGPSGSLTCVDRDARKIALLQRRFEGFTRFAELPVPAIVVGDAADPALVPPEMLFDRVLLDAPCTALGVIARHPEARWRRRPEDVDRMAALQKALLSAVSAHVKPGGRIVYAVCSTDERESSDIIDAFLADADFTRVPAAQPLAAFCDANGDLLTAPVDGRDGFFAACLERAR